MNANQHRLIPLLPVVHGIHQEIADDRERERQAADQRQQELNGRQ